MARDWKIVYIDEGAGGWDVVDAEGIAENFDPFLYRAEAEKFRDDLRNAYAETEANNRYWSSAIFGE